jgi:hypothetical protein
MKCEDCALFVGKIGHDGNYHCDLCNGTFITSEEKNSDLCKYTKEKITDQLDNVTLYIICLNFHTQSYISHPSFIKKMYFLMNSFLQI